MLESSVISLTSERCVHHRAHFPTASSPSFNFYFPPEFRAKLAMMKRLRLASTHIHLALLLIASGVGGCASTSSLPREDRVADFASIKSKAVNAPLNVNRIAID